jgi:hypothetical protein
MTGDQADFEARLWALLPPWFGDAAQARVVGALVAGAASTLAWAYDLYLFAKRQTRIATSTGGWLGLSAADFFATFPKFTGETDANYSRRIRLEVLRDRNTRHAIDRQVFDLTQNHPEVFEAWRPGSCGGWGTPGMAWGVAGRWGSDGARGETIIVSPQLQNYGIPNRCAWGTQLGGYGQGNFSWVTDDDMVGAGPTQNDFLAAIERLRTEGCTYYVRFTTLGDPNP